MFSTVMAVCKATAVVAEHRPTFWAIPTRILVVDYPLIFCTALVVVIHDFSPVLNWTTPTLTSTMGGTVMPPS
jgi:hypothetical protein